MNKASFPDILAERRSIRGFLDDPVPRVVVEDILRSARTAPSGANLQPGSFHALTAGALDCLVSALVAAIKDGRPQISEYSYFPDPLPPHLKARQRETGYGLYSALGIDKRDIDGRKRQFEQNYRFFNAPVGIVVTIDRSMGKGCFMDLGMAIQSLFIAAQAKGYATCGIGALASYGDVVAQVLELPDTDIVVCGIALGRADWSHRANSLRTTRISLDRFTTLRGFTDQDR